MTRNRQVLVVVGRPLAALRVPSFQVRQLDGEDRRLQRIETEIAPYLRMLVRGTPAVVAQPAVPVPPEFGAGGEPPSPASPIAPRFFVG